MNDTKRLGTNIKLIRVAYGETQEQLGAAIGVEKNTISYYEKGAREPNKDILAAIAKHYMISIEELLTSEMDTVEKIEVDPYLLWREIDTFIPIISTDEALGNTHFKKAYERHRILFESLKNLDLSDFDFIKKCIEEYEEACKTSESKIEATANELGLIFLIIAIIKMTPEVIEAKPAVLSKMAEKDKAVRELLEEDNSEFVQEAKEILKYVYNDEMLKEIDEAKLLIKSSQQWSDLADYYMALQYLWNIVDNGLSWELNRCVGFEMLKSFVSVGNRFAAQYIIMIYKD